MNLKERALQLKTDIPALFLALKSSETPFSYYHCTRYPVLLYDDFLLKIVLFATISPYYLHIIILSFMYASKMQMY